MLLRVDWYSRYYAESHQSRRLAWVHSQGVCTIVMDLKRKHEVSMSTYQVRPPTHTLPSAVITQNQIIPGLVFAFLSVFRVFF